MKSAIAGALVSLAIVTACAQDETLSACDALRRRGALDSKVVAIRGIQIATDEGGWLVGQDCGGSILINGRLWKSAIWLEMSESSRWAAGVSSADLDASIKRIDSELKKRGFDPKTERLLVTYTGVFEAYDDEANHTLRDGFGHLNAAPVELIVTGVKDAVVQAAPRSPKK